MDYSKFTPGEMYLRELERLKTQLDGLRRSETEPDRQESIAREIELLHASLKSGPK